MANDRHRLAGFKECADEIQYVFIAPQFVRIHDAAGKQQPIVILRPCLFNLFVDGKFLAPIFKVPALDLAFKR